MDILSSVFSFLDAGVSPFHAVDAATALLDAAGYTRLAETATWQLTPGQGYYVTRNGSAIIAFRMPTGPVRQFRMSASHSDSPTFRIKSGSWKNDKTAATRLEVEGYGGMLMPGWMDRPLTAAGRVTVRTDTGIAGKNIYLDKDLLVIPSLCIHFDRTINDGKKYNIQTDLQPLLGDLSADWDSLLAAAAGVDKADLLDADLTLCPRQKATRVGAAGEYFMSPRIDDLECAATTLLGFLQGIAPAGTLPVWAMLDNEEVGSSSRQGAQSTFLRDVLTRCLPDNEALQCALANSFLLSADNGHAVHPNQPGKSDPLFSPVLNGGPVLKYNASQKYTTTGLTGAVFTRICQIAGVPVQKFANRGDVPGGSTLGNLAGHSVSVPMADIGLAQLAMHACVETAGCRDVEYMARALTAYYSATLEQTADGVFTLG